MELKKKVGRFRISKKKFQGWLAVGGFRTILPAQNLTMTKFDIGLTKKFEFRTPGFI